ncbi:MAG: hypothetical protein MRJ65_14960 [Candidatus Brocadiaceae bacterium]|nr:hypothetical protein [Candidatus Brocadiaceae bacterium]
MATIIAVAAAITSKIPPADSSFRKSLIAAIISLVLRVNMSTKLCGMFLS